MCVCVCVCVCVCECVSSDRLCGQRLQDGGHHHQRWPTCVRECFTGTQDYLCPIDSEVFGEAYEQLASVEHSFYSQKFEDAAQSCLSVMQIRAADIL